jgi:hypothetical protein
MTIDSVDLKAQGKPTVQQCEAVYSSLPEPTVRGFHAKLLETGYDISLSGAQRFIAKHIKKSQPHRPPTTTGSPLTSEELDLIQKDLAELQLLDTAALKMLLDKELVIYNVMLLRFSQRKSDKLAMVPKDSAALVKAMFEANGKVVPLPVIMPDGQMIDVTPNEQNPVSEAIQQFIQRERGIAN